MADVSINIRFVVEDAVAKRLKDLSYTALASRLALIMHNSMDNDDNFVSFGDIKVKMDDDNNGA